MKYRYRNEDEMKDSGVEWIGKIPEEWYTIKGKYLFNSNKQKNSGRLENILSLTLNGVIDRDKNNLEGLQPENFDGYQEFYSENLVFKLIDLQNINTSRVGYVHKDGLMSPAYIKLAKKKGDINTKYYFYNYFDYYNQNIYNFLGSVGVRSALNSDDLLEMVVINTSISEQNKISKFLDEKTAEFDSIISKKEALIQKLEEAKKSLISEVVTGKVKVVKSSDGYELVERKIDEMKDSEVEWLGMIPKGWKKMKVSRITNVVRGSSPRPAGDPLYFGGNDVPWITVGEVTKDDNKLLESVSSYLTELGKKQSRYLPKGTLVMSNSGATLGVPKILNISGCINDGSLAFLNLSIDKNYLYYLLKSRTKIFREEMQISGQPNLNTDVVKGLDITMPNEKEQSDIAKFLDIKVSNINSLTEKIYYEIEKIKEAKQSLISEAVTGKIEILE